MKVVSDNKHSSDRNMYYFFIVTRAIISWYVSYPCVLFRYSVGTIPVSFLNTFEKYLGSVKPTAKAMLLSVSSVLRNISHAFLIRIWRTKSTGVIPVVAFTLLYSIGGQSFLGLLTDETTVIHASESYFYWVLAIPLAGFSAFLFDGIFIGATATHLMLKAMIVASVSFFLIYYGFRGTMGNHALWMAFITYLLLRGVMQGVMGRNILGYKTSKKD